MNAETLTRFSLKYIAFFPLTKTTPNYPIIDYEFRVIDTTFAISSVVFPGYYRN